MISIPPRPAAMLSKLKPRYIKIFEFRSLSA